MPVEADAATPAADAALEREAIKLEKRLVRQVAQAIGDFGLIEDGDKVMVCVSGGKDSYGLLDVLRMLQQRNGNRFELIAVNLDQKQPGFPAHVLPEYLTKVGVPFHIETQDTYSVVKEHIPEGQDHVQPVQPPAPGHSVPRGRRAGCHQDRAGPPPRRHAADVLLEHVLRRQAQGHAAQGAKRPGRPPHHPPLAYVAESDLTRWAEIRNFPSSPAPCAAARRTCSASRSARCCATGKQLYPGRIENMAVALRNLVPSHFMDTRQFDFKGLVPNGVADADGDKAFDAEELPAQAVGMLGGLPLMPR